MEVEYVNSSLAISPLAWLILGHLAGDFLFQTRWMALNKPHSYKALFIHSFVYTAFVTISSFFFGGLHVLSYVLIFVIHLILDKRDLLKWWLGIITKAEDEWLAIVTDQIFHLFTLVAALYLTIYLG